MAARWIHLLWAAPMAFAAGWAAQRASLCNVRAVADWVERRDGQMLATLLRASVWATAATGVLWATGLAAPAQAGQAAPMGWAGALLGGLLFGMGATLNKGCSLSTLIRLAEGQWGMLVALAGFVLGARVAHDALAPLTRWAVDAAGAAVAGVGLAPPAGWAAAGLWWLLPLAAWAWRDAWRSWRSARQDPLATPWWQRPAWPLQQVAWVFGLAGAAMYGAYGAWTYTNLLRLEATGQPVAAAGPQLLLVAALLAGMVVSAWRAGDWSLRGPDTAANLWRHLFGGALMGMGSVAIPGGNDSVLLAWMPGLRLDGVAAYLGILAGIAAPMLLRNARRSTKGASAHRS